MPTPNDIYQAPLYNGIGQGNEYTLVPGVCILPLAEDPPTTDQDLATYTPIVIAQLHAPYRLRKYNSVAHKQNNPPVVPSPMDQGSFVFMGGNIQFVSRVKDGFVLGSAFPYTTTSDQAGIASYLNNPTPTIGAIANAGNNAIAGYNLGNQIVPNDFSQYPTGMNPQWSYSLAAFYPGNFFNDQLANGGGV